MAQHKLTDTITFRRGLTIPNRIALAPMQSQSALEGGYASNDTIRYYNHRSKAAGLLITEFHMLVKVVAQRTCLAIHLKWVFTLMFT